MEPIEVTKLQSQSILPPDRLEQIPKIYRKIQIVFEPKSGGQALNLKITG
jgi:hypothetical protein